MSSSRASSSIVRLASRCTTRCNESRIHRVEVKPLLRSNSVRTSPARRIPPSDPLPFSRRFATSSASLSQSTPIKDPDHPSEIYFHQLPGSAKYAISYLSTPPSSPTSASIIAYVTPPRSSKEPIYDLIVQQPDLVEANEAFLTLMHDTLKNECVPEDGMLEYEAYLRKDGWAHLNDQRLELMPGRISTPENIIASVAFIDEKIMPESYERNATHRIVTGEEGFMELRPTWHMFVKKRCEEVN